MWTDVLIGVWRISVNPYPHIPYRRRKDMPKLQLESTRNPPPLGQAATSRRSPLQMHRFPPSLNTLRLNMHPLRFPHQNPRITLTPPSPV